MDLLELLNWAMRTDVIVPNIYYVAAVIGAMAITLSVRSYKRARRAMDEKAKQVAKAAEQQPPRRPGPYYFNG
jgi:hypothetical protein